MHLGPSNEISLSISLELEQKLRAHNTTLQESNVNTNNKSRAGTGWINNNFTMVYDSGSTAPFTGSEDAMMKDSIETLPKPIPVKMGAANTFATKTGIIPFCLEDKLNSSVGIMCLVRFFLVPDFFKDLKLMKTILKN